MRELVFLLEEPSARRLLEGLVPRLVSDQWQARYIVFEGKQDLEKNMGTKLRAWRTPGALFVVLRDQDALDCKEVKARLVQRSTDAGRAGVLVRVACRELEAWILGDLPALAEEFKVPAAARQRNRGKFAQPDVLVRPVEEILHFIPDYQKGDGARRMGARLDPNTNQSASFRAFCEGVIRITQEETA